MTLRMRWVRTGEHEWTLLDSLSRERVVVHRARCCAMHVAGGAHFVRSSTWSDEHVTIETESLDEALATGDRLARRPTA